MPRKAEAGSPSKSDSKQPARNFFRNKPVFGSSQLMKRNSPNERCGYFAYIFLLIGFSAACFQTPLITKGLSEISPVITKIFTSLMLLVDLDFVNKHQKKSRKNYDR